MKKILSKNVLVKVSYEKELPSGIFLPDDTETPKTRMAEVLGVGGEALLVKPKDQVIVRQFGLIATPTEDEFIIDERNILAIILGATNGKNKD